MTQADSLALTRRLRWGTSSASRWMLAAYGRVPRHLIADRLWAETCELRRLVELTPRDTYRASYFAVISQPATDRTGGGVHPVWFQELIS